MKHQPAFPLPRPPNAPLPTKTPSEGSMTWPVAPMACHSAARPQHLCQSQHVWNFRLWWRIVIASPLFGDGIQRLPEPQLFKRSNPGAYTAEKADRCGPRHPLVVVAGKLVVNDRALWHVGGVVSLARTRTFSAIGSNHSLSPPLGSPPLPMKCNLGMYPLAPSQGAQEHKKRRCFLCYRRTAVVFALCYARTL